MSDNERPMVLWIDEDQTEMYLIPSLLLELNAQLDRAMSVAEAQKKRFDADQPRADAIILDCIVRPGGVPVKDITCAGLTEIWAKMDADQRRRTVVVSVVPAEKIAVHFDDVPRNVMFLKNELDSPSEQLRFLGELRRIIAGSRMQ